MAANNLDPSVIIIPTRNPFVSLNPSTITVDSHSNTKSVVIDFNVFVDYNSFSFDTKYSWLTINRTGNATIDVTIAPNTTSVERQGFVTVYWRSTPDEFGRTQAGTTTLPINQAAGGSIVTGKLSFETFTDTVDYNKRILHIPFKSENISQLTECYSSVDWFSVDQFSLPTKQVIATVAENKGNERRGLVTLEGVDTNGNNITATKQIIQTGIEDKPYIKFDNEIINAPSLGAGFEENFTTPYSYQGVDEIIDLDSSDWNWLIPSTTTFRKDGTFYYILKGNGDYSPERRATMTIKARTIDGDIINASTTVVQEQGMYYRGEGTITLDKQYNYVNHKRGKIDAYVYVSDLRGVTATVTPYDGATAGITDVEQIGDTYWKGKVEIDYGSNDDETQQKLYTVIVNANGRNSQGNFVTLTETFSIFQSTAPKNYEHPIWEDVYADVDSYNTYVDYKLVTGEGEIYSGRAYKLDGEVIRIKISDIVRNYINEDIEFALGQQNNNGYISVMLLIGEGGDWQEHSLYRFWNDWSYEQHSRNILNDNVSNKADKRQFLPLSVLRRYNEDAFVIQEDYVKSRRGARPQPVTRMYDSDLGVNTLITTNADVVKNKTYTVNGESVTYELEERCNDYCLYYLNELGGWDFLLIDGKIVRKKNFEYNQYNRDIDVRSGKHRIVDYKANIEESWDLSTGYLTDSQSDKLYRNLFGSTRIYLHNLNTDEINPVNLKTASIDRKTFRNQGRKFAQYTFNVALSDERLRR